MRIITTISDMANIVIFSIMIFVIFFIYIAKYVNMYILTIPERIKIYHEWNKYLKDITFCRYYDIGDNLYRLYLYKNKFILPDNYQEIILNQDEPNAIFEYADSISNNNIIVNDDQFDLIQKYYNIEFKNGKILN